MQLLQAAEEDPRRVADIVNISSIAGRETPRMTDVCGAVKPLSHGCGHACLARYLTYRARGVGVDQGSYCRIVTQHLQEAGAVRPDALDWDAQRDADLGVRRGRLRDEQGEQLLAGRGQVAERRAQRRVALGHKQFLLGCPDLPGRDVPGVQGLPASVRSVRGASDTPAFLLSDGGEPAGDRGRIADCRKLVHELLPDSLPDVGGIGAAQPVSAADGPGERGVPVDKCVPRLFVTVSGTRHKVGDGQVVVHRVSILSGQRTGHRGWCAGTAGRRLESSLPAKANVCIPG
jgi:hypothetical protein